MKTRYLPGSVTVDFCKLIKQINWNFLHLFRIMLKKLFHCNIVKLLIVFRKNKLFTACCRSLMLTRNTSMFLEMRAFDAVQSLFINVFLLKSRALIFIIRGSVLKSKNRKVNHCQNKSIVDKFVAFVQTFPVALFLFYSTRFFLNRNSVFDCTK